MANIDKKIGRIRTGGQSGADRAAMDFARERGIPIVGWCPKNGWAEDYPDPQGKLLGKPMYTTSGLEDVPEIIRWISDLPDGMELCIGGPRASECSDAYDITKEILDEVAAQMEVLNEEDNNVPH